MTGEQRRVLWTASVSHAMIHVYELAVPALLLLIQAEFGAGDFAMGRVVTLYGLLFGVGALPAGFLVDRFGARPLVVLCLWGSAGCVAGMALSPSLGWFAVAAGCMGLCLSIYHPAGTSLITHAMPLAGRTFAVHGMLGNLGVAGSSVIAGTLGALLGWRWALGLLAAVGGLLGFVLLTLPDARPDEIRRKPGDGDAFRFVLLLVAIAFVGMVYRGLTTFLPKYLALNLAGDGAARTAVGGALTTAALLVGLAGMYVAGRLTDRGVAAPLVFFVGVVSQAPFLVALGQVGAAGLVPVAMAVAFCHFMTQPSGNYMVARYTPAHLRGLGYGVYFFLSFGAGSLGASLGGWISDSFGLEWTFPALALLLVPAFAAAGLLALQRRAPAPSSSL